MAMLQPMECRHQQRLLPIPTGAVQEEVRPPDRRVAAAAHLECERARAGAESGGGLVGECERREYALEPRQHRGELRT